MTWKRPSKVFCNKEFWSSDPERAERPHVCCVEVLRASRGTDDHQHRSEAGHVSLLELHDA